MGNNPLSYTSRDFKSIKQDLINAIPSLTDIWTNREESDPGMVLLTLMSAVGDNLSYNMDKQSLEFFGKTVTQRKNASRLFDLVGYKMHWYKSAELEIEIFNNNNSQIALLFNPTGTNTQRLVSSIISTSPAYFILYPQETASNWNTNKVITIPPHGSEKFIAVQGELNAINFTANSIDANNRYYLPVSKIDQSHMWLADDKQFQWYLTDNINELTETLPRFEFGVDEYNLPYIELVAHWRTSFGETHNFTLYYLNTRGSSGAVTSNVLNSIPTLRYVNSGGADFNNNISIVHGSNAYVSDNLANVVGKDPQSAQDAYEDSRNYIGTYNTLVTLIDFENFVNRLDIISAAKAVDGQYATELNEKLLSSLSKKFRHEDDAQSKILNIYNSNLLSHYNQDSGEYDDPDSTEHFGYNPYSMQLHMVAGNFLESNPYEIHDVYASTKEIKVEDNSGYIEYMLNDKVVGASDDSIMSQSGMEHYKLFTADVSYAPVRKFPFFINGQIHLKEPMRPAEANLVLYNVYTALQDKFNAYNLKLGEKINFKDILDTVNEADDNIYYFDAGANNDAGSLVVYPKAGDFDSNHFNLETNEYELFNISIDPKYFNEVSMQSYADRLQNNNVLMYFCNTFSSNLTIAEDSISEKDTPPVYNTTIVHTIDKADEGYADIKLQLFTIEEGEPKDLIIDNNKLIRFAVVEEIAYDGINFYPNDAKTPVKFYDDAGMGDKPYDARNWITDMSQLKNWPIEKYTRLYECNEDHILYDVNAVNTFVFAAIVTETITTNESDILYSDLVVYNPSEIPSEIVPVNDIINKLTDINDGGYAIDSGNALLSLGFKNGKKAIIESGQNFKLNFEVKMTATYDDNILQINMRYANLAENSVGYRLHINDKYIALYEQNVSDFDYTEIERDSYDFTNKTNVIIEANENVISIKLNGEEYIKINDAVDTTAYNGELYIYGTKYAGNKLEIISLTEVD